MDGPTYRPVGMLRRVATGPGNIHYNISYDMTADGATRVRNSRSFLVTLVLCGALAGAAVKAAVTDREAAALKSGLTPLGATRAGNEAGTIPP